MVSRDEILIRNKIIGVLLRMARLRAEESAEGCAHMLSVDPAFIMRAEEGEEGLSLPQLESLARHLHVSLSYLLGEEELPAEEGPAAPPPYENIMLIRHKIIGLLLRQARLEAGRTLDDVAPALGWSPEHLARIELGEEPIALVELDALAQALGVPFDAFVAQDIIPLTAEERNRRDLERLAHLPQDMREFVLQPVNVPYLQVAMSLSHMSAEALRQIASGLLEITL